MNRIATITPETILTAYAQGAFPMADNAGVIRWYTADPRGILPLDGFNMPRSLRQVIKRKKFEVRINHSFRRVMEECGSERQEGTWINRELVDLYCKLHQQGFAHSVECWYEEKLAGGLYGVAMGAAFFGESMFTRVTDASKVALAALVERLRLHGYELLDTQAVTNHLRRFGCVEIPSRQYLTLLGGALTKERRFA